MTEQHLRPDATEELTAALEQRILVIDGAMGTAIQRDRPDEAGYRGDRFADWPSDLQGNNDLLTLTQPHIIADIHREYLAAGADILVTSYTLFRLEFDAYNGIDWSGLVLDEAQDLSAMQCHGVARRCPLGSVTVLGDLAQGTTPWSTEDWHVMLAHLGKPATRIVTWVLPLMTAVFAAIAYETAAGSAFLFFVTVFVYGLLYRVMSLNAPRLPLALARLL